MHQRSSAAFESCCTVASWSCITLLFTDCSPAYNLLSLPTSDVRTFFALRSASDAGGSPCGEGLRTLHISNN